jgi:hypothetical protein
MHANRQNKNDIFIVMLTVQTKLRGQILKYSNHT